MQIRESVMIAGRWTLDIERLVCDAMDAAFEAGVQAMMQGRCSFRLIRWVSQHEREPDWTHRTIGDATAMTRETVTRLMARLRQTGMVVQQSPRHTGYVLTREGRAYAAKLDHVYDLTA